MNGWTFLKRSAFGSSYRDEANKVLANKLKRIKIPHNHTIVTQTQETQSTQKGIFFQKAIVFFLE